MDTELERMCNEATVV